MQEETSLGAYYAATAERFLEESKDTIQMMDILCKGHEQYRPKDPLSDEQQHAWESSLHFLRKSLRNAEINGDQVILLEAILSKTRCGIDVVLCGKSDDEKEHATVLELKTWHTRRKRRFGRRYDIRPFAVAEGCSDILVSLHTRLNDQTKEDLVSREQQPNPRLQVSEYAKQIRNALWVDYGEQSPVVTSCVVLYNCTQLSELMRATLAYNIDPKIVSAIPVITQKGCDGSLSLEELSQKLHDKHCKGQGMSIYEKLQKRTLTKLELTA